ncbi:MAG: glycosyltransferase [Oscillospiraceae bacterium]|jgi:glycosyltransferase involved in cell wall biosynthesis|nr:glycosyltransferase [Oscillospiraceae bacterium]
MQEQKRLSLCVITKNDEEFLPACLSDMSEIADEMLVVDLGSADRTVELAEQAVAVVYQPEWEDDFSKIRNFCMEHAVGQWVLFLQADEVLSSPQRKNLRLLLQNPNAEAYLLYVDFKEGERGISSPAQFLRLYRNRKEYRFRYRSFAYIPDEILYSVQDAHLCITHRGEQTVGWQLKEQIRLLKEDEKEHPQDGYVRYLEGIELLNLEKFEQSVEPFEAARQAIAGGNLYVPHLYKCYGYCLMALERYEEAEKILTEGIQTFTFYNDLLALRAQNYDQQGRSAEAIADLETCLTLRKRPNPYVPGPEIQASVLQELWEKINLGRNQSQK